MAITAHSTKSRALTNEVRSTAKVGAARAEALVALILRRKQRITEDFFDIGEALRELFYKKLYLSIGYPTFEVFIRDRKLFGETQARKLIAIVESFSREQALSLGLEKAFAVITYAAATPAHQVPQLVLASGISGTPVADLSIGDIAARAKSLRAKAGRTHVPTPAEKAARAAAKAFEAELRRWGLSDAVAHATRRDGKLIVEVRVAADVLEAHEGKTTGRGRKR
jgi:hypothetical protein